MTKPVRAAEVMNAVADFAEATGMRMANNTDRTDGLAVRDIGPTGTFTLVEFIGGIEQLPFGANRSTSISQIRAATLFAKAFALTPNIFGERSAVVVDDEAERDRLVSLLNEAGGELSVLVDLDDLRDASRVSRAISAIAEAKRILLKRTEVQ